MRRKNSGNHSRINRYERVGIRTKKPKTPINKGFSALFFYPAYQKRTVLGHILHFLLKS